MNSWQVFSQIPLPGGEIYVNPENEESELCGTTASLTGIERFDYEGNMEGVSRGIRYDVALHALLLSLPGIPVLRSGDEVGQLNDYTYKADISKASDPRWLHNGRFNWALARNRADAETIQGRIFNSLEQWNPSAPAIRYLHLKFLHIRWKHGKGLSLPW